MRTILIVDDVRTDREVLGRMVEATGSKVVYAANGEEALVQARAVKPALVLMDVVMPGLDGFGACRRLKKEPETAQIPVVLITHKGSETDQFWGRKQGADDYVVKPYTSERIRQVIQKFSP